MYFSIGCRYAPKGKRLIGGLIHSRDRATHFGGTIAIWSFLFNSTRGLISYYR